MQSKQMTYAELMRFKYSDVPKHSYATYFCQEADGTLRETSREDCFDFSRDSEWVRFFADPESGLCIRLAKCGQKLGTVCFAAGKQHDKRLRDGRETNEVLSFETCRSEEGDGTFTFDAPDMTADTQGDYETDAFNIWLESQLSVDERGLYRAVKNGYTANECAKLMAAKNPAMKPNSVWRRYDRMMAKLLVKVENLRAEWDRQ